MNGKRPRVVMIKVLPSGTVLTVIGVGASSWENGFKKSVKHRSMGASLQPSPTPASPGANGPMIGYVPGVSPVGRANRSAVSSSPAELAHIEPTSSPDGPSGTKKDCRKEKVPSGPVVTICAVPGTTESVVLSHSKAPFKDSIQGELLAGPHRLAPIKVTVGTVTVTMSSARAGGDARQNVATAASNPAHRCTVTGESNARRETFPIAPVDFIMSPASAFIRRRFERIVLLCRSESTYIKV